ncbi:MAG: bifunctional nuclease family protein [Candidatus Marinimicrobia bacterium]|nr:bifunctional nuclease family protein [Candidatus Neomarinimicrobiota bacterium]
MIEVIVKNIIFFSKAETPGYTLFLNPEEDDSRSLPIVVGQFEAQAIALALEQVKLERPMTHDLLSGVISSLTDGLESVAIVDLKAGTFYAHLYIRNGEKLETMDARPSDAIALALRAGVPIRVRSQIFKEVAIIVPATEPQQKPAEPSFSQNIRAITREAEIRFDLEKNLREAISREDYEQAARIRDRLHSLPS